MVYIKKRKIKKKEILKGNSRNEKEKATTRNMKIMKGRPSWVKANIQ